MKARASMAEILAITNNVEKKILSAGVSGIKAGDVKKYFVEETGIAEGTANRIINNLLKAKIILNAGGSRYNKLVVHRDAEIHRKQSEQAKAAKAEALAVQAAKDKAPITDLNIRFDPANNSLSFLLKNIRITVEVVSS